MSIHVVQYGDTLWGISQTSGVPVSRIMETNGLTRDQLMPGLALYLPTPSLPERFYRVKPGDVLWRIAQTYRVSVSALLEANPGLIPEQLQIGQTLVLPSPLKYEMNSLAFLDAMSSSQGIPQLQKWAHSLNFAALVSTTFQSDGTVRPLQDAGLITELKRLTIQPLMVLANFSDGAFSPELADAVLDSATRVTFIQNIVTTVSEKRYAGVSIDFEFMPPARRSDFSSFLSELKSALGSAILHVNVPSKTTEMLDNRIVGAVDYEAVGESADLVTVLTYDYGYPTGPPNPVSPPWWIAQVLTYATSLIPKEKVTMGFPLYGYDWNTETLQTRAISANVAQNKAIELEIPIQYSSENETPYYSYYTESVKHTLWFEDIRSLTAKYRVLESFDLGGVAFWRFGFDFPQNWEYLNRNAHVKK